MSDDLFDFGFTAVNEEDLASVEISKKLAEESSATVDDLNSRLDKMYGAIKPLLNNLKKNPEKEFILWPDPVSKIEEFEAHLLDIYNGE